MSNNIKLKTPQEIELMHQSGAITAQALKAVLNAVRPGITTLELNSIAEKVIDQNGAKPSFKGYDGFGFVTCININEGVVHGVPSDYVLKEGDMFTVDVGSFYKGFHSDAARSAVVLGSSPNAKEKYKDLLKFMNVGRQALANATAKCVPNCRVGDISHAIQTTIEPAGYTVIRDYVGHGIGRDLHEDPEIPCFGDAGTGLTLQAGAVVAVEVMWMQGDWRTVVDEDGWTVKTRDRKVSGLFENTIAITESGPVVLTAFD